MRSLFAALILLAVLPACNHSNTPLVAPKGSPDYFRNDLGQTAYVNILYTPNHHGIVFSNMALLRQITVPAGATVPLGDSLMQQDKPYMIDWHSEDHTYSNFALRLPQNFEPFHYYPLVTDSTVVLSGTPGRGRLYCLGTGGKGTHWESVNAYNKNGESVWDTLMSKKYHSVYMDIMGHFYDTARLYPGQVTYTKDDLINKQFLVKEGNSLRIEVAGHVLTNDLRPLAPLHTTSPDSLYLIELRKGPGNTNIKDQPPYLLLVKTKTIPLK